MARRSAWRRKIFRIWRSGAGRGRDFSASKPGRAISDPEDFSGDLFAKPSMRLLEPGNEPPAGATYAYLAARRRGDG